MNYFFITGSSQGLGKSLTELLLEDDTNFVYGFARSCTIRHQNYLHTSIDLTNLESVKTYCFPEISNASRITLINNAGIVGNVQHLGNIDSSTIISTLNINLIAPAVLINSFLSSYKSLNIEQLILNISSGAGRTPIDGWSIYCSSKSGLDMLSQVLQEEINIDKSNVKILSLAPGIIDTGMQTEIRKSNSEGFSNIERFIEYKKNGDLSSPESTAKKVLQFIDDYSLADHTLCSVRDLSE